MHAPLPIALARRAPLAHRKQDRPVTRQRKKYLSPARFHRASQHPGQDPATIQTQQKGATVCACIARPPLRTVGSSCKARTCRKAPLAHATNDFQLLVAAGRPRVRYLSKRGAPDMLQLTDTPGPTGMEVTRPRLVHSGAPSHSKKTLPPWAWRPPPTAGARRAMALAPAARKQSPGRPGRRAAPPRSLAASRGGAGGCPSGGGGGGGGDPSREGKRTAACRGSVGAGGGAASTRFRRSRTPLTVRAAATTYPPSTPGCCRGGGRGSDRDVLTAGLLSVPRLVVLGMAQRNGRPRPPRWPDGRGRLLRTHGSGGLGG